MTTTADRVDFDATLEIHHALEEKGLLPDEHLQDSGYVKASHITASQKNRIELIGPIRASADWQAKTAGAYDLSTFDINGDEKQLTCPNGKTSSSWAEALDPYGNEIITINFRYRDCMRCDKRPLCTRQKKGKRQVMLKPKEQHEAIQAARQMQQTPQWQKCYNKRAGIEGTISQEVRTQGLSSTMPFQGDKAKGSAS